MGLPLAIEENYNFPETKILPKNVSWCESKLKLLTCYNGNRVCYGNHFSALQLRIYSFLKVFFEGLCHTLVFDKKFFIQTTLIFFIIGISYYCNSMWQLIFIFNAQWCQAKMHTDSRYKRGCLTRPNILDRLRSLAHNRLKHLLQLYVFIQKIGINSEISTVWKLV